MRPQIKKEYVFVDKPGVDYTAVRLTDPQFENLIYKYNRCKFGPADPETNACTVSFSYDIIENPGNIGGVITDAPEFMNLLGDILVDILDTSIREQNSPEKSEEFVLEEGTVKEPK